jgi:general secretion pathway protein J
MTGAAGRLPVNPQAGFTLVELLVAITLLSLLSLVLTSSLRFGLTAWARGTDHAEGVDHSLLVQSFLRRTIGDAYPYFSRTDPTRAGQVDFAGTAQSLRFLASAPRALGGSGRVRFEVSLRSGAGHSDVMVASIPELADATIEPTRNLLMPSVAAVEFAYFGRKRADRQAAWHEAWTGEPTLPQLVRLKVRLPSGDARLWPDLVIVPRIAADVSCVYDPLTKRCRGR